MNTENKNNEQQSRLFSCSLHSHSCNLIPVSEKPGSIKLTSSEPGCYCITASSIKSITECPRSCQTCTVKFTSPKPVSFSVEICECPEETPPSSTASEEVRTHEHKSFDNSDSMHKLKCVQPSDNDSEPCLVSCTGACSSQSSMTLQKPLYIDPDLQNHTPKSIEELKASIAGITGLENKKPPLRNPPGCEYIEFRCEFYASGSVCEPEDSETEPSCSDKPIRRGFSLTVEPNDHRFCINPENCKHSRESFEPPPLPCTPAPQKPEELPSKPKKTPCEPKKPPCEPEKPPCEPEKPPCQPEKPPCQPEKPPCHPEKPPCELEKPPCEPEKPPCQPEEPPCQPEEPPCQPEEPPCQPKESTCTIQSSATS